MDKLTVWVFTCLITTTFAATGKYANRGIPGNDCYNHEDCVTNAICQRPSPCNIGRCTCVDGYTSWVHNTNNDGGCSLIKLVGESCSTNSDTDVGGCIGNSECTAGACACPTGTTADADNTWCTGVAAVGEFCTSTGDLECKAFSDYLKQNRDNPQNTETVRIRVEQVCTNNECTCNKGAGYYLHNGQCIKSVADEGEACNNITGPFCNPLVLDVTGGPWGLECTPSGCACPAGTTVKLTKFFGGDSAICAHPSTKFDLEEGMECRLESDNPAERRFCVSPLMCSPCYEDHTLSVRVCRQLPALLDASASVSGLFGSLAVIVWALLLSMYL